MPWQPGRKFLWVGPKGNVRISIFHGEFCGALVGGAITTAFNFSVYLTAVSNAKLLAVIYQS